MEQELAYSFHLGSDKNKSKLAKRVSKDNVSAPNPFIAELFLISSILKSKLTSLEIFLFKGNLSLYLSSI